MNDPFEEEDSVSIPFVLTRKHGGEYDDEAFSAGWNLALLDARLTLATTVGMIIPPILLRAKWKSQADLLAMSYSLLVKVIPTSDPEYSFFVFGTTEFFQESEQ